MTIFNPQIPDARDPTYLNMSRPSEDNTLQSLFKGVGSIFSEGVTALDTLTKQKIDTQTFAEVNKTRDEYQQALTVSRDTVAKAGGPETGNKPASILPYGEEEIKLPNRLENFPTSLEGISTARANGKLSETMYYAKLDGIAKSLRAEYPGYREYIDSEISKITGGTPANQFIKSILGDINSYMTNANKPQQQAVSALGHAVAQGIGGAATAEVLRQVQSGERTPESGMKYLAITQAPTWESARREAARKEREGQRKETEHTATDDFIYEGSLKVNTFFSNTAFLDPKSNLTMKDIQDKVTFAQANPGYMSDENATKLGIMVQSAGVQVAQQLRDIAYKTDPDTQTNYVKRMGGADKVENQIKDMVKPFETISRALLEKNLPLAAAGQALSTARLADYQQKLLTDKGMGPQLAMMSTFNKLAPDYSKEYFKDGLGTDLPAAMNEFKKGWQLKMMVQPDINLGRVYTPKQAIQDAVNKGVDPKTPEGKSFYKSVTNVVDAITNSKSTDVVKANTAVALFSPENNGMLSMVESDARDPQTGRKIPGNMTLFTELTSSRVTKEIVRLSEQKPELLQLYKNWSERSFSSELFSKEIEDLKGIAVNPRHDMEVTWSDKTKQFAIRQTNNPSLKTWYDDPRFKNNLRSTEQSLSRLNEGLSNLKNIAEATGSDVEAYLFQTLMNKGLDPTSQNMRNIPEAITRAIYTSRIKQGNFP